MENKDFIIQAYEKQIALYERLIAEKDNTIEKQENEIIHLRKMVDKFLEGLNSIKEQLSAIDKDPKSITIEINNKNEGVNMSNINQSASGSGDNVGGDKISNTNDLRNATLGGGLAGRDYTGDVINNNDTLQEIQQLINQYSQNQPVNNTSDKMKIATQVIETIENNPNWKQRAISAAQQGVLEALKSNPIGAFVAGAIEGWKG